MDIANMTPKRPYLIRAFYDWLVDNELTPHLVVEANLPGVRVPLEFVQDGQIILNVAPRAVGNFEIGDDAIMFHARFSGRPHSVIVPIYAVQAIYARENGAGTMFEPEDAYEAEKLKAETGTLVGVDSSIEDADVKPSSISSVPSDSSADSKSATEPTTDDDKPKAKGRPSLSIVK